MRERWSRAWTCWRGFFRLPQQDRVLLMLAALALPAIALALKAFGLRRVHWVLTSTPPRPAGRGQAECAIESRRIARLVGIACRHGLGRPSCLARSLALWWLMRREGIHGRLCVGARKHAGKLEAHAWVEHAGRALNDTDDVAQRFPCFDSSVLPADGFTR